MNRYRISVTETGAVPGAENDQTRAFQTALDRVWQEGGGIVEVPAGKYLISSVRIRSDTTLLLRAGAELYAIRDSEAYGVVENDTLEPLRKELCTDRTWEPFVKGVQRNYSFMLPGSRWNHAIIRAVDAENIAVVGEKGSVIDGQNCFDEIGEEKYRGPHGMDFAYCANIRLEGYTIRHTGNWAHCILYSRNISCKGVTVLAGHDGIHLTRCENVSVEGCEFYTGDDCVAGFANLNTVVRNCVMNTACSGLRMGGTNVVVTDCRFFGPAKYFFRGSLSPEDKRSGADAAMGARTNMLSVLTYYSDFSVEIPEQPGNIVLKNCTAENTDRLLHFNFSGNERWQSNRPLQSLWIENVSASGIGMPLTAYGSAEIPLSLTMKNVQIVFRDGDTEMPAMKMAYCDRVELDGVTVTKTAPGELIRVWSPMENAVVMKNVVADDTRVLPAAEPFSCKAI